MTKACANTAVLRTRPQPSELQRAAENSAARTTVFRIQAQSVQNSLCSEPPNSAPWLWVWPLQVRFVAENAAGR